MINAAISGLLAAGARFNAAAHEVANVNTRKPDQAPADESGPPVDVAEALVDTTLASVSYSANLTTLRTWDETVGTLLSVSA